jgi:hypothetical protein
MDPTPDVLTLNDLLSEQSFIVAKEAEDRALLETIGLGSVLGLKPKLVEWATKGFPYAYPILSMDIRPPVLCSDGEVRDLQTYIQFCSGRTIAEHVALLQAKLPDMVVSYANFSGMTTIVVSKN